MNYIIKPQLTMASHMPIRTPEPHDTQTAAEIPVPVIIPTLSLRSRIALLMQIAALWLVVAVVITTICLLNMEMVYCVVFSTVAFLAGCMFTGLIATHQYREHLPEEASSLMTQQVRAITKSDIVSLAHTVSMRTSNYLKVVRLPLE